MPFINGKHYMNPQYGAAMERARQTGEGKFGTILSVLADILDELNDSSSGSSGGGHIRAPRFGDGGSAQGFPRDSDAASPRMIPEPYPAQGIPPDPENPKLPRHRPGVIPIPLARNGAQGEFVQERQGAQRSAQEEHQNQANHSADGHWVTIDHRHIGDLFTLSQVPLSGLLCVTVPTAL